MKTGRVILLVIGCFLLIPGIGLLFGGGGLGLAYATQRDDDGYFDVTIDRIESESSAITAEDLTFAADPGSPDWLIDAIDADVRLRVTNADSTRDIFVGIAREADVDAYLSGVAHDEVSELDGRRPIYRTRSGPDQVAAPTLQTFWSVNSSGPGTQEVTWEAAAGRWAVVVMNADGSAAIAADVNAGVRAGFVLPLALIMLGLGAAITAAAVALIIGGTRTDRAGEDAELDERTIGEVGTAVPDREHPVLIEARLDPDLSRWKWLVKWILAIPHFVVLVFLWVAFVVLTVVAGFAILFTGRYPRGIFDFNVGVMRWSWRVSYYAASGGIGTDRYPPFRLGAEPGDPARLDVAYPEHLRRGLVPVKWLLAVPHLVIVALLTGTTFRWLTFTDDRVRFDIAAAGGLLGVLALLAGGALLFTGRYPPALFDLIVGFNRWIYRVMAYVALMTDAYPPFRLDQGGAEPIEPIEPSPPSHMPPAPLSLPEPTSNTADRLRDRVMQ